jgi:hypothetical protein
MRGFAFKFGLSCSALWIALKLIVFFTGNAIDWFDFTIMANNFLLLTAVTLTIFIFKKSNQFIESPWLEDVKAGIFGGIIYTLAVVFFSYFYNAQIDSSVLDLKVEQRVGLVSDVIKTEAGLKLYRDENVEARKYSREQIITRERESTLNFINPKVSALILMMFFTLLSIFYAFFITLVIRKIYLPGRR